MTNELEHYGILGMKWGVRRTPEQLGHVKKSRKNEYGYIKGQNYANDVELPKGTIGYRVQAKPGLKKGPLYLSYDSSDHLRNISTAIGLPEYGVASDSMNWATGEQTLYSLKLEAKEPIKAPSFSHAMETFVEMVGDIGIAKINPYSSQSNYGRNFIENWKKRGKYKTGAEYSYRMFVETMRRDDRSKFFEDFKKRLADKGYNALIDPEDRPSIIKDGREDIIAKAPFIILDPQKTLKIKNQSKLTREDQRYITRYYDMTYGNLEDTEKYIRVLNDEGADKYKKSHEKWKQWLND